MPTKDKRTNAVRLDDVVLELMVSNESLDKLNSAISSGFKDLNFGLNLVAERLIGLIDTVTSTSAHLNVHGGIKDLNFGLHIIAERLAGLIELFEQNETEKLETRLDQQRVDERNEDLLQQIDTSIKGIKPSERESSSGFFGEGLLSMFKNVMPNLLTGLLPAILGAVSGLTVGFLGSFFKQLELGTLAKLFRNVKANIQIAWAMILDTIEATFPSLKKLKSAPNKIMKWIEPVIDWFKIMGGHFKELKALFTGGGEGAMAKIFGNFMQFFTRFKAIGTVLGKIMGKLAVPLTIIMSVWDGIKGAMQGYKEGGIEGAIKGALKGVINGLIGWVWDMVMGLAKWIYRAIGWNEAAQSLEGWNFKAILDGIFKVIDWILYGVGFVLGGIARPFIHPLDYFSDLWKGIKALPGILWNGMKVVWDIIAGLPKMIMKAILPDPNGVIGKLIPKSVYEYAGIDLNTKIEDDPKAKAAFEMLSTGKGPGGKVLNAADMENLTTNLEARGYDKRSISAALERMRASKITSDPVRSGMTIDSMSRENAIMNATSPMPVIINGGGSGGGGGNSVNVNNITYQPNNLPDRSLFLSAGAFA